MSVMYGDYVIDKYDESGNLVKVEFNIPDNFNFAYDVIDRYAKEEPDKRALVYKDIKGNIREFSFSDISRLSTKAEMHLQKPV